MLKASPLLQLYLVRLRDFYRQPARVFWVYGFPTLMAVALGLAFQNRPPAPIAIDLVKGSGSAALKEKIDAHNADLEKDKQAGKKRLNAVSVEIHEGPEE